MKRCVSKNKTKNKKTWKHHIISECNIWVLFFFFYKIHSNIQRAQSRQQKTFGDRKRKFTRSVAVDIGHEVLISQDPKKRCTGNSLGDLHQGPFTLMNITSNGVASVKKACMKVKKVNLSRLRPYYRLTGKGYKIQNVGEYMNSEYCNWWLTIAYVKLTCLNNENKNVQMISIDCCTYKMYKQRGRFCGIIAIHNWNGRWSIHMLIQVHTGKNTLGLFRKSW